METVANAPLGEWIGVDPDQIRQELESLFPGVTAWFGEYTGHWWALLGGRLVEARDPLTLAERIRSAPAFRSTTPRRATPRPAPAAWPRLATGAIAPPAPHRHHAAPRAVAPAPASSRPAGLLGRIARLFRTAS